MTGDRAAVEQPAPPRPDAAGLYRRDADRLVRALVLATGRPDVAADAVAEAFARAVERWGRVGALEQPAGWVRRTALNVARRRLRREALERRLLVRWRTAPGYLPPDPDPELWERVGALPPRQREAVALRYVLDLSEAEVAAAMGVALGTATQHLARARARLRDVLQEGER